MFNDNTPRKLQASAKNLPFELKLDGLTGTMLGSSLTSETGLEFTMQLKMNEQEYLKEVG